jgi:hypothetical protein
MNRQWRCLSLISALFVASASGCVTRYRLDILHETRLPKLDGSTVAVLPPFASSGAEQAAIVGRRTAEAAFCAPLGSVRFLGPDRTVETSPVGGDDFAELRRSMSDIVRDGPQTPASRGSWLFHGDRVGPVELRSPIDVTIVRRPSASNVWTSEVLAPATLAGIPADYVLVSIALARFRQVTRVTAFADLLPVFWSQDLQATRPASLFLLYETATGRRVWEAVVSVSGVIRDNDPRYAREVVDSRVMPILGVAHLLTGEFEVPFARTLETQAAARSGPTGGGIATDCLDRARAGG